MTLQETERRRRQSKRDREAEQDRRDQHLHDEAVLRPRVVAAKAKQNDSVGIGHNRGPPLTQDELKVLTIKEWAALCGFSVMTAKRLIAAGKGPRVIQLSSKRIGIRMVDAARWSEEHLRSA